MRILPVSPSFLSRAAAVAMALGFLASTAHASRPDMNPQKTLSPFFVVKGGDPGVDGMPLKGTHAEVQISGTIARVKVTQTYKNEGKKPLEAIYVFPGSVRAAVFGMRMTIGKRVINAKIKKREEARKLYEAAKAQGKSASLLEQQRPNVFTMNVANIMPGDEIKVEMDYTELLVPTDGNYEFVYPAVVGPRYTEKTAATAGPTDKFSKTPYQRKGQGPSYAWGLKLDLDAGVPIQSLASPSHRIDPDLRGTQASVRLGDGEKGGDADFVLKYGLRGDAVSTGALLYESGDEKFFLAMVQPPKAVDDVTMPAREYVFIVDVSGSMRGFALNTAKKVLGELFTGLRPQDRFNVMMFSGGRRVLAPKSVPATQANLAEAMSVMGGMSGGGGTRLLPALKEALAMPAASSRMSRSFVVVTDGYVTVEAEAFELIRSRLGEANLFTFGIGSSVNRHLIDGMARAGLGEPFVILKPDQAAETAKRFHAYIASPALTNISVTFEGGFRAYDVEPKAVPDLFAQRPVIVFGKYKGSARGRIVVSGTTGKGTFRKAISVSKLRPTQKNDALRYLWARHRIARLADMNRLRKDDKRVAQVTKLGLRYNLMTAYTSFVAIDQSVRNKNGKTTTVKQPLPLPKGVEETAVGRGVMGAMSAPSGMRMRRRGGYGSKLKKAEVSKMPRSGDKPHRRVRVTLKKMTVFGTLTKAQLRPYVNRVLALLRRCHMKTGTTALQLIVTPDGKIQLSFKGWTASVASRQCIRKRTRSMSMAAPGGTTRATLILNVR